MPYKDPDQQQQWREAHAEQLAAYHRVYYLENRERLSKYRAAKYATDDAFREAAKARARARAAADPVGATARAVAWNRANKERRAAIVRRWHETHPENVRLNINRRKVRKLGNGGSHTVKQWLDRLVEFDGKCAYCGAEATEKDHVVSLSRGGTDDIINLLPACRPCNRRKHNQAPIPWLERALALYFEVAA